VRLTALYVFLASGLAYAQAPGDPGKGNVTQLPETTIRASQPNGPTEQPTSPPLIEPAPAQPPAISIDNSRSSPVSNAVGSTPSASEGRINQLDLANQPFLRPGDALEYIPGLIVQDHTGTTKANELFLRGFFLDHGTDFSVWIDDVPYNMPNHPHLHGYDDFNSMIPELVQYIDFKKGVYYPEAGDFSSAGTARITLVDSLPYGIFKSEFGKDSYFRDVVANSGKLGQGTLLYAASAEYFNGPWEFPENSRLFSGLLRYTLGDDHDGIRLNASAYSGIGRINDNIPTIAVEGGFLDRLGTLDPFEGINTQRYQLNAQWWHKDDAGDATRANVYFVNYHYSIWTNTGGDGQEFQQAEHRDVFGTNLSQTFVSRLFGENVHHTFGTQLRYDDIPDLGTNSTDARNLVVPLDEAAIQELNAGFYYQNEIKWGPKVRTIVGFREDYYHWNVDDHITPENSGKTHAWVPQPKGSLILGPWADTVFYLNGGYGFHTNDARGIFNLEGGAAGTAIARTRGAEVGFKTQKIPNLTTTFALWYLHMESEFVFDPFGLANPPEPRGESNRYGIELSNTYRLNHWLTFDTDWAASQAHFTSIDDLDAAPGSPGGSLVPQAVGIVFTAGPTIRLQNGCFLALQYRYLGPRDLTSDGLISSRASNWFNLGMGYESDRFTAGVNILNLFNSNGHEIDFANTDGVTINGQTFVGGTTGHPMEPFQARFYFTLKY
jgi:hypothetical protein